MSKDGMTEFALMFKEREKGEKLGICTGTVINGMPNIEIRINEHVVLDKEQLVFASRLLNNSIEAGETLIVIPSEDQQTYYVVDKAVTV